MKSISGIKGMFSGLLSPNVASLAQATVGQEPLQMTDAQDDTHVSMQIVRAVDAGK